MANDLIVTLDSLQLLTGLSGPVLESTTSYINYVGDSYFLTLWTHLAQIGASLWIEDIWRPTLQRENNEFIMDRFTQIPGITRAELRQANAVRLYMRVLTIADLAHPTGEFIPDGMLTGRWQAESDFYWPYQTLPPPGFRAVFQRCLQLTFCMTTSPRQPIENGMDLDKKLGLWFPVKRNAWFDVYRSRTQLFWRHDDAIYLMIPSMH